MRRPIAHARKTAQSGQQMSDDAMLTARTLNIFTGFKRRK